MIYVLIGMSLFFITIGYIVTEDNAQYLLSGYNTMKDEDRQNFDIKGYITYFRRFHLFLGISFLALGLLLYYLVNEETTGVFLGIYPIVAYIYFAFISRKFSKTIKTKWNKLGIYILIGTLLFVIGLMYTGIKEDKLIIHSDSIEFTGSYPETLNLSEIQNITLVKKLPNIILKLTDLQLEKYGKDSSKPIKVR